MGLNLGSLKDAAKKEAGEAIESAKKEATDKIVKETVNKAVDTVEKKTKIDLPDADDITKGLKGLKK